MVTAINQLKCNVVNLKVKNNDVLQLGHTQGLPDNIKNIHIIKEWVKSSDHGTHRSKVMICNRRADIYIVCSLLLMPSQLCMLCQDELVTSHSIPTVLL